MSASLLQPPADEYPLPPLVPRYIPKTGQASQKNFPSEPHDLTTALPTSTATSSLTATILYSYFTANLTAGQSHLPSCY